jgi:4-amino-4-deoxy-L-arabinose transferase-like glycosyltransferase
VFAVKRYAWHPVAAVAGVTAVAHLAVASRYGWHRDELYYVESGRHLAFGYPDQPPLTPILARLAAALPGGVLPLRIVAIAAQVGCVLLAAALARELGGRARAQTIAAACVAASPIVTGTSLLLGTTIVDQLAWAATIVLVAAALRTQGLRAWIGAGVVAGFGLENKSTVVVLIAGIALGLVLVRREVLKTPGPWIAGAIAFVLWLPNLVWNARNGWPALDMARVLAHKSGGPLRSLAQLPLALWAVTGLLVVIWFGGVRWLVKERAATAHRWLLAVAVVTVVVFTATGGKIYYSAPALLPMFAAAGCAIEARGELAGWFGNRKRTVLIVVSWVTATALLLPFLPVSDALVAETRETYGWPQLARQVAAVAKPLTGSNTVVFTSNYGEAGAITRFGPRDDLRLPVLSGHNAYGYWGPPSGSPDVVVAVGEFDASYLRRFWKSVTLAQRFRLPDGIKNEEIDEHAAIFICRDPKGTWAYLWPRLRHLD